MLFYPYLILYNHARVNHVFAIPESVPKFFDLTIVLSGKMIYNINNEDVVLNPLDVIFIKPGDVRKRYATNEPVDYVSFIFITDL